MNPTESYDNAFQLCHVLKLHINRFSDNKNLIIYPSSWYNGFFEITFRDNQDMEAEHFINRPVCREIVAKYLPDGWVMVKDDWSGDWSYPTTPVVLQFKKE